LEPSLTDAVVRSSVTVEPLSAERSGMSVAKIVTGPP
jgi:hypothetical protein